MGGSVSGNLGKSESSTGSNQRIWGPQGQALQNLYGNAENMFDTTNSQNGNFLSSLNNVNPYMSAAAGGGLEGMNKMLQGGTMGDTTQLRDELMSSIRGTMNSPSNTSQMYQSIVGGAGNTYIDPMVAAMKSSSMDNLAKMQNNTGLDAAAMGQGGSSRHAMQNAMLGAQANKDMLAAEMNMRGGAYDKDLAMKMNIANLADQNVQAGQDRMLNMLNQANTNISSGMGYGQQLQNLGMGMLAPQLQGMSSGWDNLSRYSDIIGAPQVLGSSRGSSEAKSTGSSFGMSAK